MASPSVPPGPWKAGVKPSTSTSELSESMQRVQAHVVQHHYVRSELHDINQRKGGKLIEETINALKLSPQGKKCTRAQLLDGFHHMTRRLQTAELTINFKSPGWFMKPNNFSSYTQMYERAVREISAPGQAPLKQMRLKDDPLNPANVRAATDDRVTFGNRMAGAAWGGVNRVMSPGALKAPTMDAQAGEWEASNPFFNPKSKQVFAALNYGRRPHGSTFTYGHSYMVLNSKFKTNAIYFAGDTFTVNSGMKVSAEDHISYDLLGAIYAKATDKLREDLYKSCILDGRLADASSASMELFLLLEAHLFEPLTFSGNVEALYISGKDKYSPTGKSADARPITGAEWQAIQTNARTFAAKHGARVVFIE